MNLQLDEFKYLVERHRFKSLLGRGELRRLHAALPLGKNSPRRDSRNLRFAKYSANLPAPPSVCNWTNPVTSWPMMLNDTLGDCTCAAAGHMQQCWTANVGVEFIPTDAQIESAYELVGGYVPGNPSTDNGADEVTVLNSWRQTGIAGRKISAYVAVNPQNATEVKQAINLFGGIYTGLAMPLAWQGTQTWDAPSSGVCARVYRALVGDSQWTPGSWGGHAVPVLDYDTKGYTPITWGSDAYRITSSGFAAYCDEAYAVVSQDFLNAKGVDPQGFDVAQLMADLQEVAA